MAPVEDVPRPLVPVGNTLRMGGATMPPDVALVLVVGSTLTSHFWLNILPLAPESRMRYYVTEGDLGAMVDYLHVRPTVVPAFLPSPCNRTSRRLRDWTRCFATGTRWTGCPRRCPRPDR